VFLVDLESKENRDQTKRRADHQLFGSAVLLIDGGSAIWSGSSARYLRTSSGSSYQDIVSLSFFPWLYKRKGGRKVEGRGWNRMDAEYSSPDLIVHGVLDHNRPMADIKEDLKSIMERLVCDTPSP
jgi:hypothetical protein